MWTVSELVFSVPRLAEESAHSPFGSAFPSPDLFRWRACAGSHVAWACAICRQAIFIADMTAGQSRPLMRQILRCATWFSGVMLPMGRAGRLQRRPGECAETLPWQCVTQPGDLVRPIESPAFYACLQVLEAAEAKSGGKYRPPRDGVDLKVFRSGSADPGRSKPAVMAASRTRLALASNESRKQELYGLLRAYQVPLIED